MKHPVQKLLLLTCISLPIIANSIAIHNIIRGINGYSSLHKLAKCCPVTTPSLAANSFIKTCDHGNSA